VRSESGEEDLLYRQEEVRSESQMRRRQEMRPLRAEEELAFKL
jgi:hypothetical protein